MAVYEYSRSYEKVFPWIKCSFLTAYRHIEYVGLERIPKDSAILFAPNHCNALMDALAVLFMDNQYKVFVSRADIFHNPHIAAILHWLRIMPIRRVRDGLDEVRHNDETIMEAIETLRHGVPFCIMAEGTHHPERTILPLKKGIFRIALHAHEGLGDEKPVYIVPVRLEFRDLYHLWDSLRVTIGEPLSITGTCEPHTINALLAELQSRMESQIEPDPWGEKGKKQSAGSRLARILLLTLTAPIALLCAATCLPIWVGEAVIRHKVADECFHTSVLYVWRLVWIALSLGLMLLPWIALEEWRYQLRTLLKR